MPTATYLEELRTPLADLWPRLDKDQLERLHREYTRLREHYAATRLEADDQHQYCEFGIVAAAKYLLGDITPDEIRTCVEQARDSLNGATAAAKIVATMMYEDLKPTRRRISQQEAANAVGLNRGTLDTFRGATR